jgi:hypothetical protein
LILIGPIKEYSLLMFCLLPARWDFMT